jgi:hypothetical protein
MEATCGGSGMSDFECLRCEHHKNRAARWRAEAYKQAGHDKIELPWVGLTDEEVSEIIDREIGFNSCWGPEEAFARAVEQALKEKNT